MNRAEFFARTSLFIGLVLVILPLWYGWKDTALIHARMTEDGGWSPTVIRAEVGKPLHLRFTSDDVVHGFAVGQMNMPSVDIYPGKVSEVTLTFDKSGVYTFYCTRWCGLNHWRMRGVIEVSGEPAEVNSAQPPLYVSLGLNLDAPHEVDFVPSQTPSAMRGRQYAHTVRFTMSSEYYRTHSPAQLFTELAATDLSETKRWDLVAYLWWSNTTTPALANGKHLYTQNCAACHGEVGAGDGVFAEELARLGETSLQSMTGSNGMTMKKPTDFTDPRQMLGASPALLQGKILRGGMGTGMPMFGAIFTDEQIWDLVAYLYTFQFEYP
ncbi:MAG: hypothetical protein Kow0088_09690 [Anaerolineales bacterium]